MLTDAHATGTSVAMVDISYIRRRVKIYTDINNDEIIIIYVWDILLEL